MYKRIILFNLIIFTTFIDLFSTYACLESEKMFTIYNFSIYDNCNKVSIKFKDNKVDCLNTFVFSYKDIKINKRNLFINKELFLDLSDNIYNINIEKNLLKFTFLFYPFVNINFNISSLEYKTKNFKLQNIFYYNYPKKNYDLFIDYSSLNFTKKGVIYYIDYSQNKMNFNGEIALSKFGLFYSSKIDYQYKKIQFFLCYKNLNEKFYYGLIFNYHPIRFEIKEKIYPKSLYGGQGTKREFYIKSKINFIFKLYKFKIENNVNLYHNITYDKFLSKKINNEISITEKFKANKNDIEISIDYINKLKLALRINNVSIKYMNDILEIDLIYCSTNDSKIYNINISTKGEINISFKATF